MSSASLKLYASPRYNIKVFGNLFKVMSKGVAITYLSWGAEAISEGNVSKMQF